MKIEEGESRAAVWLFNSWPLSSLAVGYARGAAGAY